jgi:single-stranded DNA-binding protein
LNSILIEGIVSGNPGLVKEKEAARCSFVICNTRYVMDRKKMRTKETRVQIMVRDAKLAEVAEAKAREGRRARVVGRIAEGKSGIYIAAEHIEYNPYPIDAE